MLAKDFEWAVAGAVELREARPLSDQSVHGAGARLFSAPSREIVQVGERAELKRPLEHSKLFEDFAQLADEDDYLVFAKKWGFLSERPRSGASETVGYWRASVDRLRSLMRASSHSAEAFDVTAVAVRLAPGPNGRPEMVWQPRTLAAAIFLQFASSAASGAEIKVCENASCSRLFAAGGAGGRRADARFCSTKCRTEFNNARRRA